MNVTRSHSPPGRRRARERAASLVEYCMVVALIAFVCILAVTYLGDANSSSINDSADSISTAG